MSDAAESAFVRLFVVLTSKIKLEERSINLLVTPKLCNSVDCHFFMNLRVMSLKLTCVISVL